MSLSGIDWSSEAKNFDSGPAPARRASSPGSAVGNFIGGLFGRVKNYLDQNHDGKVSLGEVGSGVVRGVNDNVVKPVVDAGQSVYHEGNAARMSVGSILEGHHGAQLAQDKAAVQAEFRKSSVGKAAPELASGNINKKTGQVSGAAPVILSTARRAAGAAGSDTLSLASVLPAGKVLKEGASAEGFLRAIASGAKTGAKYGATQGALQTMQEKAPTLHDFLVNEAQSVIGGSAVGAVGGGVGHVGGKLVAPLKAAVGKSQINDATRSNIMREFINANEHAAAVKVAQAKTPTDIVKAAAETHFNPNHVSVPVEKQNINPSEGPGVHEAPQPAKAGPDVVPPPAGDKVATQLKLQSLEQQVQNHSEAPPLAVERARTEAQQKGYTPDQHARMLSLVKQHLDQQQTDRANTASVRGADQVALTQNEKNANDQLHQQQDKAAAANPSPTTLRNSVNIGTYAARRDQFRAEQAQRDQSAAPGPQEMAASDHNASATPAPHNPDTGPINLDQLLNAKVNSEKPGQAMPTEPVKSEKNVASSQSAAALGSAGEHINSSQPQESVNLVHGDHTTANGDYIDKTTGEVVDKNTSLGKAAAVRDSMVREADKVFGHISDQLKARGIDPNEFAKALHLANRNKADMPENMQAALGAHNMVLDELRSVAKAHGVEYGVQPNYFPESLPGGKAPAANLEFSTPFNFAQKRSGVLGTDQINFNYQDVMHSAAQQVADAVARVAKDAHANDAVFGEAGRGVEAIAKQNEVVKEMSRWAKAGANKAFGLIDRMHRIDNQTAQERGLPMPERTVISATANGFERWARDGWVNLKNAKTADGSSVWSHAFEPLARAGERAAYNFETHFKNIQDVQGALEAFKKSGVTDANQLRAIHQDLNRELRNGGKPEAYVRKVLTLAEKSNGQKILSDFIRTHEFTDPTLKGLVQHHAEILLSRDTVVPDTATKIVNGITGTISRASLGLNLRSAINHTLEAKRVISSTGIHSFKDIAQATNSDEFRRKYGIGRMGFEDVIDRVKKDGADNLAVAALKGLDKAQMALFVKTENWKNELMLRSGENQGKRMGLTGDALFQHTMDYYERNAHVHGQFGHIGVYDKKWARIVFQFGQYAAKDWGLNADHFLNAVGKREMSGVSKGQSWGYLSSKLAMDTAIYLAGSAAIGMSMPEAFGVPNAATGPIIGTLGDLWNGYKTEMATAQKDGRAPDLTKVISRNGKRALVSSIVPSGNQLINKTGIQALLPDSGAGGAVKKALPDGALMDMERGYNPTASGNVRFMAPNNNEQRATATLFGPYSTQNSTNYFNHGGKSLGKKQSQEVQAAAPDQKQAAFDQIQQQRADKKAGKNTAVKPMKTHPPKTTKAKKVARKVSLGGGSSGGGGKPHKSFKIKSGLSTTKSVSPKSAKVPKLTSTLKLKKPVKMSFKGSAKPAGAHRVTVAKSKTVVSLKSKP